MIGDEEARTGRVKIKRMADGEEQTAEMRNACETVRKLLKQEGDRE